MFLPSLYFTLLAKLKSWQTTETYSPQTFSVTAAIVAPTVVICLNSLLATAYFKGRNMKNNVNYCIMNMAYADFLMILVCMPRWWWAEKLCTSYWYEMHFTLKYNWYWSLWFTWGETYDGNWFVKHSRKQLLKWWWLFSISAPPVNFTR